MAKMVITHNGFTIKMGQKEGSFIYDVSSSEGSIVSGSVYVGDADKLESVGKRIKQVTGLDIEIDSN